MVVPSPAFLVNKANKFVGGHIVCKKIFKPAKRKRKSKKKPSSPEEIIIGKTLKRGEGKVEGADSNKKEGVGFLLYAA